jgi:hypothetical protein
MVEGLRELIRSYKREYDLTTAEALAKAREGVLTEVDALERPTSAVMWYHRESLFERDPQRGLERWEEIKRAARDDLSSGLRSCQAVDIPGSTPWNRAQYLALRQELMDGWQPRNGVERQLVEAMAQARTAAEFWLKLMMARAARDAAMEEATMFHKRKWEPPGVTGFQVIDQAGAMVDRFNRMFLRSLRALRDLRRWPSPVFVQNAGQVNVGQQQVNVAQQAVVDQATDADG